MKFDKRALSPSAIAKELQEAVSSLPEGESWEDYFEGGTGRTIIELIAGSQAIKNHYNLMRVRESTLQYAKLDSSVTELAINKGVYRPPAKSYILEVDFKSVDSGWYERGDIIGTYKNYDVIVLERTEYLFGHTNTVKCTIGKMEEYNETILSGEEFLERDIKAAHQYLSEEFQQLVINGDEILLIDEELNLYDDKLPNSCLRLTYDYFSRLIFGDGIIGKRVFSNDELKFRYISFGADLLDNFYIERFRLGNFASTAEVLDVRILRKPTKYLDKEILRKIAIRNSVDGRWVQVQDYENGILREFGEYIADIIVKDEYPAENITILPKEDYITDTVKAQIRELVDNKRGNATLINIDYLDPFHDDRLRLVFSMQYIGTDAPEELNAIIDEYTKTKINRIRYSGYWLTCADLAVELTNLAPGGKFYPTLDEKVYIEPLQSIERLSITYAITN